VGVRRVKTAVRRDLCWLLLLSIAVRLVVAIQIPGPGYVDAAYYASGAVWLARGGGLTEPFLWHYLDDPEGLPRPGYLYWMVLPSLLAAPLAALCPGSFLALQMPFVLLSALLPLVSFALGWSSGGRRRTAWAAGLFTLFSGFFFPYWTLPETFAPFALFGSVALWLASVRNGGRGWGRLGGGLASRLGAGILVGLAHLTRPDGLLLLLVVGAAPFLDWARARRDGRAGGSSALRGAGLIAVGYLAVMAPWFLRNMGVAGTPLSTAGTKTLWLRTYDDLFSFERDLSFASYVEWGGPSIVQSKLWALGINLQRFVAEDCLIFLFPFAIVGYIRLSRRATYTLTAFYLAAALLLHSLLFSFPGARGGFFHASAPAIPMIFAAAASGLSTAVRWAGRRRRWRVEQAQAVFTVAAVIGAAALSGYAAWGRLRAWKASGSTHLLVDECIAGLGGESTVVMVNDPPSFWYYTRRPAVAVPNEDVETVLAAARRHGVSYLVLDSNRPDPLADLYSGAEVHPRFDRVCSFGDTVVLEVLE
jgi:hypothetical protein